MSQVTEAFCRQMLVHVNRGEHAPLTIGEQRQLAYAWLELNRLGTTAPPDDDALTASYMLGFLEGKKTAPLGAAPGRSRQHSTAAKASEERRAALLSTASPAEPHTPKETTP